MPRRLKEPSTTEQELRVALGNLIQWAVRYRYSHAVPEVKAGLKALARSQGWPEDKVRKDWMHAADAYKLAGEVADRLVGKPPMPGPSQQAWASAWRRKPHR